jgi:hypothetical protein
LNSLETQSSTFSILVVAPVPVAQDFVVDFGSDARAQRIIKTINRNHRFL